MYILYIALVINLGFAPGSFVGHSEKPFETIEECNKKSLEIYNKADKLLGKLMLKYEDKCIKLRSKGANL